MTKKELKEKYTEWNKEISALEDRKNEIRSEEHTSELQSR